MPAWSLASPASHSGRSLMATFHLLWFCSCRARKKRGPHSSGRLSRFYSPCELGEEAIRADLTPAVPCGATLVSRAPFGGTEVEGVCAVSQGGDFSLSYLTTVTTSKLHLQTALDPAFLSPALCLYPHWQPQRISTTSQPGSLREPHGCHCQQPGSVHGPLGTQRAPGWPWDRDTPALGWVPPCPSRVLTAVPSECLSPVSLLLSQHGVQLTRPRAAAPRGTEPAAGSASPGRAPPCSCSAC